MNPTPATMMALLFLGVAFCLVALSVGFVRPRPHTVPRADRPADAQSVRGEQRVRRHERRAAPRRTARAARAARTAPPAVTAAAAPAAPAPSPEPAAVVTAYYRALDARRYSEAWTVLAPSVRAAFGGLSHWRAGFATTLSNTPRDIEVVREGAAASIAHELVTEDRSSCGPVRRRFAVRWRLVLTPEGWRAASLSGVKRSGPEPAEACADRQYASGGAGGL